MVKKLQIGLIHISKEVMGAFRILARARSCSCFVHPVGVPPLAGIVVMCYYNTRVYGEKSGHKR